MQYDIDYHVDEKNRVVVATAYFGDEIERLFEKKIGINFFDCDNAYKMRVEHHLRDFTRVVARCHPDDVFDVEIGKKICRQKLKDKFYKKLNGCFADFIEHYSNLVQKGHNALGDIESVM